MTIRTKLFGGFLLMVVIFIASFFINQALSNKVANNSLYLSNSESIIRNSNLLHKSMIDMQNGFRGYLLTSQESFLQPYYEGLDKIPVIIKEQHTLLKRKQQRRRLDSIVQLHDRWINYANSLIVTKKDTLPGANEKYKDLFENKLRMEVGKRLNDEIKLLFTSFDSFEYMIRQERRENLHQSIKRTRNFTLVLMISSITIAILTSIYIISLITSRINVMTSFAEDISKGRFIQIIDRKNDELKNLSVSLNKMSITLDKNINDLTKKNLELDQFAYVVSHDLKAPLRGIDNLIKWLEEDHSKELTTNVKGIIDQVKVRTKRLENLINGLLDYAKIGRVRWKLEHVDLGKLIKDIVETIVPPNFFVSVQSGMPIIETERILLEQVFSNIISNAVKHHDKTWGKINIGFKDINEHYEFYVSDNGPGIEKEYHDKIFRIFQTLKEKDAFESTGVGLAIVKKIIDEQKGYIKVESHAEKGTIIRFSWPKFSPL